MTIRNLLLAVLMMLSFALAASGLARAAGDGEVVHYPLKHPKHVKWSFAGPFGKWDIGQLQRGFKVYREVCAACHSMRMVAFRDLAALGYSEEQIKAIAAEYTFNKVNLDGETEEVKGIPADRFPPVYENAALAAAANSGAAPPDFSLLAKARAISSATPVHSTGSAVGDLAQVLKAFVLDVVMFPIKAASGYAEDGPDYIYSLLTGYEDAPAGVEGNYNPYFVSGATLAMAPPLSDDQVEYDDGTPGTVDNYSKDVAAFMMWAAEPKLVERKTMGFKVMIFLLIFAALVYLTKKSVWASVRK